MDSSGNHWLETYRSVVYPWQCDHMGHMNVMWYVGKFDEASWILFARLGITAEYMRKENRGMVAVRQETDYKKEVLAGDVLAIRSRVLEVREKVVRFMHEMRNDANGDLAAVTTFTGVHLDRQLRKGVALPPEIKRRVEQYLGK